MLLIQAERINVSQIILLLDLRLLPIQAEYILAHPLPFMQILFAAKPK